MGLLPSTYGKLIKVQLKEVFETEDKMQLILELVNGGELFERIVEKGQYSEQDAAQAVRDILNALQVDIEQIFFLVDWLMKSLIFLKIKFSVPT